ncbi:Lar family restriction alleviation protein [Brucella anthropi]|uniref:Lar family restriction alleviation protein n=1 Tax=Brucella anthropi TaxID=529 RepID=UPI0005BA3BF4|nr:Lar family restriction alleviation protein [Brucella anthropi]KIU68404.1 hypothetical protein TR92_11050 [Brucella anthropi]
MASELELCPFCRGKSYIKQVKDRHPNDGEWDACCEDCGATIPEGYTEEAAIRDWNTRPAPAATDTGLVTVMRQFRLTDRPDRPWGNGPAPEYLKDHSETRELVTRSQAVELLAAERAETERWHKKAMDAGVITHSDGTTAHPMRKERDDLKADNAAQAARIKELTQLLEAKNV